MSNGIFAASVEFARAMKDPENLVAIHKQLNPEPGRRWAEPTINRAIVVLTVAAWQAFVEDLTEAILDALEPSPGSPALEEEFRLTKARTRSALGRFNTPDAHNTQMLLSNVGFDPGPSWTWSTSRGVVSSAEARRRIDEWLDVRHAIAHGSPLPPVSVLARTGSGEPTLRRKNAEGCMAHFRQLTETTAQEAGDQFP